MILNLLEVRVVRPITVPVVASSETVMTVVVDHWRHGECKGSLLLLSQGPELTRGTILHHLDEITCIGSLVALNCLYIPDDVFYEYHF